MSESFSPTPGEDTPIKVEALGEPGKRRFRLLALVRGETHILWMEKQQVQALGMAIEQMLEQLPKSAEELIAPGITSFDDHTSNQFRVGRMELGFDVTSDRIVISVHDVVGDAEQESVIAGLAQSLDLRVTRGQARSLSEEAATVVAAGRPVCTMCGMPMEPNAHVCPEQNGHLPFSMDLFSEE